MTIGGFADERFAGVRETFEQNLASGADLGAAFCVTIEGETVIDLRGEAGLGAILGHRVRLPLLLPRLWAGLSHMSEQ